MKCCIVIGSTEYRDTQCLLKLPAAENDASTLFDLLTDPAVGGYSPEKSHQLLSPTLQDVKEAMKVISDKKSPDDSIFTFIFSGHGGVKNESLYLCLQDTKGNLLSTTALPVHEVISFALELGFGEINLVIDACESGGSISDISKLASINNLALDHSPSLGILAGCYANQMASEGEVYGLLSEHLIKCLKGEYVISQLRPHLSLSEIATHISQLPDFSDDQTPVFHGVSLAGPGQFSINLNYSGIQAENSAELVELHKTSKKIFHENPNIQRQFLKIVSTLEKFDSFELNSFLKSVHAITQQEKQFQEIAIGIFLNLKQHCQNLNDSSIFLDVTSVFHGFSLFLSELPIRDSYQSFFLAEVRIAYDNCLSQIKDELATEHPFSYAEDGIAGFVSYPKRITESAALISQYTLLFPNEGNQEYLKQLAIELASKCRSGFRIVDDEQAHHISSLISAIQQGSCPFEKDITQIISSLYQDLNLSRCKILNIRKDDDDVYRYILFRGAPDRIPFPHEVFSRPCISLSIVLMGLFLLQQDKEIDEHIELFDHLESRVFIPSSYFNFSEPIIRDGLNYEFGIGRDIFASSDVEVFIKKVLQSVAEAKKDLSPKDIAACLSNSTAYKDRQTLTYWI
ncbi:MAG: caspase family protein [Bdellovibrionales bacterium]|nr:caspase family protein [Bdellovibrionales bacterium]